MLYRLWRDMDDMLIGGKGQHGVFAVASLPWLPLLKQKGTQDNSGLMLRRERELNQILGK
jgi:hypothetical protein